MYGGEPCPREHGHPGPHYWWIRFQVGNWRVTVYEGEEEQRRTVCRGAFTQLPEQADVHQLLVTIGDRRRQELERRRAHA